MSYYGRISYIPDNPPSLPDAYNKLERMKDDYNSRKSLRDLKDGWGKRGVNVRNFSMKFIADTEPGNQEFIVEAWYKLENYVIKEGENYVLYGSGRLESGLREGYWLQVKRTYIFPKNAKILSVSPDYDLKTDNEIWFYNFVDPRIEFTYGTSEEDPYNIPINYLLGIILTLFLVVVIVVFFVSKKRKS